MNPNQQKKQVMKIVKTVCDEMRVPKEAVINVRRSEKGAWARMTCIYVAYITTEIPTKKLAEIFDRCEETVDYAVRAAQRRYSVDRKYADQVSKLLDECKLL